MLFYKNDPLFQTKNVQKVIDEIVPDTSKYLGMELCPILESDKDRIAYDIEKALGGMTLPVASRDSQPPVVSTRGAAVREFDPGYFSEVQILGADDLIAVRQLGTLNDNVNGRQKVAQLLLQQTNRVYRRVEWTIWQAFQGTLTITAENGVSYTISYGIPAYLLPTLTGNNRWNQTATANPLADLQSWMNLLLEGTGLEMSGMYINRNTLTNLLANTNIKAEIRAVTTGSVNESTKPYISVETLKKIIAYYVGDFPMYIYNGGWHLRTDSTAAIAAAGTALTVRDATGFVANDNILLKNPALSTIERATIGSVSGNIITLSAGLTNAFAVHSTVEKWNYYIPNDKCFLIGELPDSARGGKQIGNFVSTRAQYGAGTLLDPKPGVFAKVVDKSNDVPASVQLLTGVYGAPLLWHQTAVLCADIQ